jgi:hypothetical protein
VIEKNTVRFNKRQRRKKGNGMNVKQTSAAALAVALCCAVPSVAVAQTETPAQIDGKRNFTPEFFSAYAPVDALDMVKRIPGFSIENSEGRRGFGENAGNVLIDGERPSTKSDEIDTILSRIPASQVERIELIEQAGGDGEAQGKGQIVNVVRKAGASFSGIYEIGLTKSLKRQVMPMGSASATLNRGKTTYEFNIDYYSEHQRGTGPEDFFTGSRALVERRTYVGNGTYREAVAGAAIKTKLGGAKINLNGKIEWSDGKDLRLGQITGPTGLPLGVETLATKEPKNDVEFEVGGDIEFSLFPKLTTKLIALYSRDADNQDARIFTTRGAGTTLFETVNRNRPSEAVFRIQNDWSGFTDHAIQVGAELAYNRLAARFAGGEAINGGPLNLSSSNVLVRETRLEPFLSDVWTISPAFKLESSVIFEFSKLRLNGDARASRSFQFGKPRIVATWTASKATTVELRAEHQVAQLDFDEFATSVDLGQGNQVDAGNEDLVPQKVTTFSALVRHKFMDRGSIQLLGSYELLRDTQDLVPVSSRDASGNLIFFDGAGNIGNSRRWNAELEITGVKGMELKYVGHYHGSRVLDPVTGLNRRASFRPEWHQTFEFRHDLPKSGIAYGFTVDVAAPGNAYFVNQFRSQVEREKVQAFVEYRKWKLGTVKLQVFNATQTPFTRERFLYSGTRSSGVITQIVKRERRLDPGFQLTLSGKF